MMQLEVRVDVDQLTPIVVEDATGMPRRRSAHAESIRAALEAADGFISAQSLRDLLLTRGGSASLPTVYRQLLALVSSVAADTIAYGGRQLYRACRSHPDHLHLICESCGSTATVRPPTDGWITKAAAAHGYAVNSVVQGPRLEVTALSAPFTGDRAGRCQRADRPERPLATARVAALANPPACRNRHGVPHRTRGRLPTGRPPHRPCRGRCARPRLGRETDSRRSIR